MMTLLLGRYDLFLDIGLAAVPVYIGGIAICVIAAFLTLRYDDAARRRKHLPPRSGDDEVVAPPELQHAHS